MGLERISEIRKAAGLTLEELSARSSVPTSTLKKISAGITVNPNLLTVISIANALGCSLDELISPLPPPKENAPLPENPASEAKVMDIAQQLQALVIEWGWTVEGVPLTPEQTDLLKAMALMAHAGRRKGAQNG